MNTTQALCACALLLSPCSLLAQPCDSLAAMEWILGDWLAQDDLNLTRETWTRTSPLSYEGRGETVRKDSGEPGSFESLRLVEMSGEVFYIAKVSHNALPVAFRAVRCDAGSAVFENPDHDFPMRLSYQETSDGGMEVTVSDGGSRAFTLAFKRSPQAPGLSADQSAMLAVAEAWVARYNAGDSTGVAELYAEDGYYASAHILAHGRDQVEQYWARGIAAGGHLDFIHPIEIYVVGDLGYFLGKYQATNAGVTVDGRIVIVGRRQAGQWKIAVHETVVRDQPE